MNRLLKWLRDPLGIKRRREQARIQMWIERIVLEEGSRQAQDCYPAMWRATHRSRSGWNQNPAPKSPKPRIVPHGQGRV